MSAGAENRLAKFGRILPRMALADADPGGSIAIVVRPPIDELCDVLVRLVADSGRILAERQLQLGPGVTRFELTPVINLPDGDYDVVITPPLAEYYAMTRIEHRLPLSVRGAL